mmetsp:Transcript_30104/g.97104  ORF Transcript_30104/g.97104 Transcript_30104/m.97104 type:complete len:255 (-) Transcript_30104:197-961(-)|eukprot:scaffold23658_cov97-Isochrysis_galbana.AAC.4
MAVLHCPADAGGVRSGGVNPRGAVNDPARLAGGGRSAALINGAAALSGRFRLLRGCRLGLFGGRRGPVVPCAVMRRFRAALAPFLGHRMARAACFRGAGRAGRAQRLRRALAGSRAGHQTLGRREIERVGGRGSACCSPGTGGRVHATCTKIVWWQECPVPAVGFRLCEGSACTSASEAATGHSLHRPASICCHLHPRGRRCMSLCCGGEVELFCDRVSGQEALWHRTHARVECAVGGRQRSLARFGICRCAHR